MFDWDSFNKIRKPLPKKIGGAHKSTKIYCRKKKHKKNKGATNDAE